MRQLVDEIDQGLLMHLFVFDRRVEIDRINLRFERAGHFAFHSRNVLLNDSPIRPPLDREFVCRRFIQRIYAASEESRQLWLRIILHEAALEQHANVERGQMPFIEADGMPQRNWPDVKRLGFNQTEDLLRAPANVAIPFAKGWSHSLA